MDLDRRWASGLSILLLVLLAGCASPAEGPPSASPSPATSTAASPSVGPSPSLAVVPSPSPVADSTSTPEAGSWYPWLPPIDRTVDPAFQVDTFVMARAPVVPVSATPGEPPYRFDTGDPDPSTHPLLGFMQGMLLVVVHGPVVVDGVPWYLLTPAHIAVDTPTGWSPAVTSAGEAYLEPLDPPCPVDPITVEQLVALRGLTDGFPVCYGNTEVTIIGELVCDAEPDGYATGATWLDGGICRFETTPSVFGLDPDLPRGTYAVTGHFMDEQAKDCRAPDGVMATDDRVQFVLYCRRAFVATSATLVTD